MVWRRTLSFVSSFLSSPKPEASFLPRVSLFISFWSLFIHDISEVFPMKPVARVRFVRFRSSSTRSIASSDPMDNGEDGLSDLAVFCDVDNRDWGYSKEV